MSQEHKDRNAQHKLLCAQIQELFPNFTTSTGWDYRCGDVTIAPDRPRPYMGRFDAGKVHWTIDVSENATFSRLKQVRVKLVDGQPVFDAERLKALVANAQAIVAEHAADKQRRNEAEKALPKLPRGMAAQPTGDGRYRVTIARTMLLDEVISLANLTTPILGLP